MLRIKTDWPTLFLFLTIVACSAVFRVTNLDLIEFKGDEAINLYLAARPLFGHPFPPGGTVSSIGLLNPPILNYLLFPLVLISLDPKVISGLIGLINSLAVGFFFLLIRRYYGLSTALIASLLLAFSPWAILFSRKIWAQDLLIPFLILLLYSLHKILIDKKMGWWAVYTAISLFLLQLHQANLIFLALITGFLLIKRIKLNFKFIILGFILGLLPLIPYFNYLIKNINDPQVFLITKGRFSPEYFPLIFFRPLQIISQGNFRFVLGDDTLIFAQKFPLIFNLRKIFYLEYLLLPLGVLILRKKFPQFRPLVYVSLTLPLAYFLLHFQPFIHYFIIIVPLLFLFLASSFTFLLNQGKILKYIFTVLFFLLLITSISFNFAFFSLLKQQKVLKGDYGITFAKIEKETKDRISTYQDNPAYQEMVLASFLPKKFIRGDLPVGRMIFNYQQTKNRLTVLEERLKETPNDPLIQNELFAFYTASPPTQETLELLKTKSSAIAGYKTIYDEAVNLFNELSSQ